MGEDLKDQIKLLETQLKESNEKVNELEVEKTERERKLEFATKRLRALVAKLRNELVIGDVRWKLDKEIDEVIDNLGK